MSIETIQIEAERLRDAFIEGGFELVEINMGLCADFAEALEIKLSALGIDVVCTGTDYFWAGDGELDDEAQSRRDKFVLPPGLDWAVLEELGLPDAASHTWIEFGGLCFDAEMTAGTKSPFNLPCLRHALIERVEAHPSRLSDLVETHDWWQESNKIRQHRGVLADNVIALRTSPLKAGIAELS